MKRRNEGDDDGIQFIEKIGALGSVLVLFVVEVGFIFLHWEGIDTCLFIAILGYLVTASIIVFCEYLKMRHSLEKTSDVYDKILLDLSTRAQHCHKLFQLLSLTNRRLPTYQMYGVWKDIVSESKESYWATSYISVSECNSFYKNEGLSVHESRCVLGKQIRRIFILDTKEEFRSYVDILRKHYKHKIEIRVLLKSDLTEDAVLEGLIDRLGGLERVLDFGISDRTWILVWTLKPNRKVEYGEVSYHPDGHEDYCALYRKLWERAAEYDGSNNNPLEKLDLGDAN